MKTLSGAVVILAASVCLGGGTIGVAISATAQDTRGDADFVALVAGFVVMGVGVILGALGLFALSRGWQSE